MSEPEVSAIVGESPAGQCGYSEIRVRGRLDSSWSEWFNGMTITYPVEDETLLSGFLPDQAALYGILTRVQNLGLPLLSVTRQERGGAT